jgi:hypothetical protein
VAHQYGVRHMPNQLFVSQLMRKESPNAEIHEEKPEVPLSALQIEQWRVELNLPAEVSDEQLLLQESLRDLTAKKRKK